MAARFVVKHSSDGQFLFVLKAGNNEVILTSELYTRKQGAETGIASVRTNAADMARFDLRTSRAGEPYFVLKAANGEIIGTSEMYSSASSMKKGIASVRKNSQFAPIDDRAAREAVARA